MDIYCIAVLAGCLTHTPFTLGIVLKNRSRTVPRTILFPIHTAALPALLVVLMQCEWFRSVLVPPIMKARMIKVPVIMWFVIVPATLASPVLPDSNQLEKKFHHRSNPPCCNLPLTRSYMRVSIHMYACLGTGLGTVLFSLLSEQNSSGTTKLVVLVWNGTVHTVQRNSQNGSELPV